MLRSLLFVVAGSVLATGLFAQSPAPKLEFPAPSPAATFKQRVGITDIEISYSRPSMRGRKIFGGLVPYGETWRTGANSATSVRFSTPVNFGGVEVPAGTYALFSVPGADEWTVILNKVTEQWGAYKYDIKNDAARVKVKPLAVAAPVETFSIGLSDLTGDSANLYLLWEKTRVPVKIAVDVAGILVPQIQAAMAAEGKKPYFPAAMYYFETGRDLKQALAWMNAGLAEQPQAFWMLYRKGLILEKMGDKAGALAAAQESLALAEKADGGIRDEYTRLNQALIARLR